MVQLLMKEKSEMPSKEMFAEILSKHLGKTEQLGDCESHAGFIAHDYISETNDDTLPVMLLISECAEFEPNSIDDFQARSNVGLFEQPRPHSFRMQISDFGF